MPSATSSETKIEKEISWQDFFASTAPYDVRKIIGAGITLTGTRAGSEKIYNLTLPSVSLHCSNCLGIRGFKTDDSYIELSSRYFKREFISFQCKNCEAGFYTFAVQIGGVAENKITIAFKYGQNPQFGIVISDSLKKILNEDDLVLFEKGLSAESHGLGVGAFSYYRRVLDNQRSKIVERIANAAIKLGAEAELIEELENAKKERQFTKAVESIKHALPKFLYIEGHNPLTLLYDAVSNDIHSESDQECLERAQTIRTLLTHLLMKVEEALASDNEVKSAVTKLLEAKRKREEKKQISKNGNQEKP